MKKWIELIDAGMALGAKKAVLISVEDISFEPTFRDACKQNFCGMYGRCWMCPPDVGPVEELISMAQKYRYTLVFQTVFPLEDSYDIEGMLDAGKRHNNLIQTLSDQMKGESFLCLTGGACQVCVSCAKQEGIPCRFPEKATASLEAYGIDVSQLARVSGMNYINGANTVTYFGAFLFGTSQEQKGETTYEYDAMDRGNEKSTHQEGHACSIISQHSTDGHRCTRAYQ
ncbi:MAG TPA: DUF2284 domain-containing protein [Anaerovoracaceae bacterium]|nr:DUF2284 domain-containing protein [Anaerovoracaceae bacterium]